MNYILFGDIVEANGRTIRENNSELPHNIPIGTLVEVKYDEWHGSGACSKVHARLWIVRHMRDCDGTPLYVLAPHPVEDHLQAESQLMYSIFNKLMGGFTEDSLTPVPLTAQLTYGYGALKWPEDE